MLIPLLLMDLLPAVAVELSDYTRKREFCEACTSGDVEKVRTALAAGLNPEFTLREYQKPPLVLAVEHGKREIVRLLMTHGARSEDARSAALEAATAGVPAAGATSDPFQSSSGKADIADTLLMIDLLTELGSDVNAHEGAALVVAAGRDIRVLDKLVLSGGAPTNACLVRAVRCGKTDVFEALLKAGFDPKWTDEHGLSLLQHAVVSNNTALLERLTALGLAVNGRDRRGRTAIFEALDSEAMDSLAWLVEHGADLNAADKDGVTPLMFQAGRRQWHGHEVLNYLTEERARVDAKDAKHRQALDYAAAASAWENAATLLQLGAVPSDPKDLLSMIARKSLSGEVDQKVLIPFVTQLRPHLSGLSGLKVGQWPLMSWAVFVGSEPLALLLQQSGADINATDENGCTPLMYASRLGQPSMVAWLAKAGADPARKDHAGLTAAEWAKRVSLIPAAADSGYADTSEIQRPEPDVDDIFAAIAKNRADDVKRILSADPKAVTLKRAGMGPVHLAAALGRRELLKLLFEHGASAQAPAADSLLPVAIAAQFNQVQTAVELGMSLDASDRQAQIDQLRTLWQDVPRSHKLDVLKVMLMLGWKARGDDALFALENAVSDHDQPLLEKLLSQGISPEPVLKQTNDPFVPGESHKNVLECAAMDEDTVMLGLLLKSVPVKEARWRENITEALQYAASAGNLPAVRLLVEEAGADLNASLRAYHGVSSFISVPEDEKVGYTALCFALEHGRSAVVEYLLAHGAKPLGCDSFSRPALSAAVVSGDLKLVKLMLEKHAELDAVSKERRSALHEAAERGFLEAARLLVRHGARQNLKNQYEQTPADLAREAGQPLW